LSFGKKSFRKKGNLKLVRETAKAFEIASEGSQMMNSTEEEKSQDEGETSLHTRML